MLIFSVILTTVDLRRRNYETVGPILFLLAVIGLACDFREFVRLFSAMYGIVWQG